MTSPNYVCTGGPNNDESKPVVDLTALPAAATNLLITTLDTAGPTGGLGTRIEAALHGIADFTAANKSDGRTMIGVLITDGDPNGCDNNVDNLATILSTHLMATGIKTFHHRHDRRHARQFYEEDGGRWRRTGTRSRLSAIPTAVPVIIGAWATADLSRSWMH